MLVQQNLRFQNYLQSQSKFRNIVTIKMVVNGVMKYNLYFQIVKKLNHKFYIKAMISFIHSTVNFDGIVYISSGGVYKKNADIILTIAA